MRDKLTADQKRISKGIRQLFPRQRPSPLVSFYDIPKTVATINFLGQTDHETAEKVLKQSGLFAEVEYQWLLGNFWVRWHPRG